MLRGFLLLESEVISGSRKSRRRIQIGVSILQRHQNDLLIRQIDLLRDTVRSVRTRYPFQIVAWVVLPEHMHAIWTLPTDDTDFSTRWRLIKSGFSRCLSKTEYRSKVRVAANERGIWQRHFWEHAIRDDLDFERHVDYLHFNPVKHRYVTKVRDWPYSSFHLYVKKGIYPDNWGNGLNIEIGGDD